MQSLSNYICSIELGDLLSVYNEKSAIMIYKATILLYFDYCDVIYMFLKANKRNKF